MSARIPPPPREIDLDSTDELPVLRMPFPGEEPLGVTDDFNVAVRSPAGFGDLSDRMHELERRLAQREDRIAELEATIGDALHRELALRAQLDTERYSALDRATDSDRHLADAEREMFSVRGEFERREAELLAAQVEIDGQRRALAHARSEVEQRTHAFRHQAIDLAELRSRSERLHEALQTAMGWRAVDQQQIGELGSRCDDLQRQIDQRDSAAALPSPSPTPAAEGAGEAAAPPGAAPAPDPALAAELATLRAGADAARNALAGFEAQQAQVAQLQQQAGLLQARIAELEAELAARSTHLGDTQDVVVTQDIIVTQEVLEASLDDSGTRPGLRSLVSGREAVPTRVLVRVEAAGEVRHRLGRRTTIGRTPDNDIQIDTNFASRHHAVVLSNAQDCIVEDLNSTNGVQVNGRRVGRQPLRDGDRLMIGNVAFTFRQSE